MNIVIEKGRPLQNRSETEENTYHFLDQLQISYWRADHATTATIEECLEVEKALGVKICKNLFLCNSQKTAFYLLMMPGDKAFKTKNLSKQIGSARLSFADEAFMMNHRGERFYGKTGDILNEQNISRSFDVNVVVDEIIYQNKTIRSIIPVSLA